MLCVISARCVAHDLHTITPWPLERTCWRRFAAQWGDRNKSRTAPLNAIIIIIIIVQELLVSQCNTSTEWFVRDVDLPLFGGIPPPPPPPPFFFLLSTFLKWFSTFFENHRKIFFRLPTPPLSHVRRALVNSRWCLGLPVFESSALEIWCLQPCCLSPYSVGCFNEETGRVMV